MIILLWISLGVLALVVGLFVVVFIFDAGDWIEMPGILLIVCAIVTWFVCGLVGGVTLIGRHTGRTACRHFGEQTGYVTKFRILNGLDGGTCLALAPNGRWVDSSQIIANVPSKP